MTYLIILDGPEDPVAISSVEEVKDWLLDNQYGIEPIAERYGIKNIACTQGGVLIYHLTNDTELADGTIEWREP